MLGWVLWMGFIPVPLPAQPETLGARRPLLSGPLSLTEAVRRASEESLEVQIAQQELRSARAETGIAEATRLPLLTLGSAYTLASNPFFYTLSTGPGNIPRNSAGEFNLGLSLPLYTGGRLEAQVAQAAAERDAAQKDVAIVRLEAVLAVKQAYFQALLAQTQVATYQEYVAQRAASLKNTRERFAVGKVPRVYILRDETELATARQTLLAAGTLYQGALADLKRALGVNPASDFTLSDTLKEPSQDADLAQALGQAQQNNPELSALALRVIASEAQVQAASATFLPQVNLYAQGELRTPESDGFGNGGSLVVAATLPVLDFGSRAAAVEKAQANLKKAQLQRETKEQELAQRVTRAWLEMQQARETIQLTQAGIATASEEHRLAQERYAVGRSIQVEVLDSSVALLRARLEGIKALYDYNLALAHLEQTTGVGLPD